MDFMNFENGTKVELTGGLTAITGETGTGKSLISAVVGLLTGSGAERGKPSALVAKGRETAVLRAVLRAPGAPGEAETAPLDIERRISSGPRGRSAIYLNGEPSSQAALRSSVAPLVHRVEAEEVAIFGRAQRRRALLDSGLEAGLRDLAGTLESRKRAVHAMEREAERLEALLSQHEAAASGPAASPAFGGGAGGGGGGAGAGPAALDEPIIFYDDVEAEFPPAADAAPFDFPGAEEGYSVGDEVGYYPPGAAEGPADPWAAGAGAAGADPPAGGEALLVHWIEEAGETFRACDRLLASVVSDAEAFEAEVGDCGAAQALPAATLPRYRILEALADLIESGAGVADGLRRSAAAATEGADSPLRRLEALRADLESAAALCGEERTMDAVERALGALHDAEASVAQAARICGDGAEALRSLPARLVPRLAEVRSLMASLDLLARKHGVVGAQLEEQVSLLEAELSDLVSARLRLPELREKVAEEIAAAEAEAAALFAARSGAAARLSEAVSARMESLGLHGRRLRIDVHGGDWDCEDRVDFSLEALEDAAPLGAVADVASSGEKARLLLLLHASVSALLRSGDDKPSVVVYDEVDAHVGGSASAALGETLRAQARAGQQVIVITHSAPLAAMADQHIVVRGAGPAATTRVAPLRGEARERELARMAAGEDTDEAALALARSLLRQRDGAASAPSFELEP